MELIHGLLEHAVSFCSIGDRHLVLMYFEVDQHWQLAAVLRFLRRAEFVCFCLS